jgi:tRNA pseudouridine38-40 synthase
VTEPAEPPGRRIRLTLHYDGSAFHGWQIQPAARTVQGELEHALARLTGRDSPVLAAGRTDRGVHATGQVASAHVPRKWTPEALHRALNAVLPPDVWIAEAVEVPLSFHARYDALARGYVYRVGTDPAARSPFLRPWCWPLGRPLERGRLDDAARRFLGTHGFRAFAKAGQPERGERCTVRSVAWRDWGRVGVAFGIVADRFLHHMVRYMVGTMVDVALGRRPPDDIDALLAGSATQPTSPPAPAAGLFLTRVCYATEDLAELDPFDERVLDSTMRDREEPTR